MTGNPICGWWHCPSELCRLHCCKLCVTHCEYTSRSCICQKTVCIAYPWSCSLSTLHACMLSHFSHVQLFATLWTVARQAPLSMIFSRKEPWRGWPCPPPGDLPNPGIKPMSLHCGGFFTTEALGKPSLPTLEMVKSPCQAHTGGQANVNSTTFLASTHPLPLCCP